MTRGPFNDKTGDPFHDNETRRINTRMVKSTAVRLRVKTPHGWKRKRIITRLERQRYNAVVAMVMNSRIEADNAERGAPAVPGPVDASGRPALSRIRY